MFCRIQRSFGVLLPQISAKNPRKSILTRNYVISTWKNPHKPFFSFPRDYSYLCAPMYKFATYKDQYKANLRLALPVVLTQLGQILTQFADNLMVGRYGGDDPTPLAAVSFGGAVFFILFVTGMGLTLGLTPLVGERFAQGDKRGAADYLKNAMIFYSVLGFLIAAVQLAVIPLMYRMGQPAEVVDLAIPYYRLMAFSMPAVMLFFAFKQFLEGVGNTVVSMVIVVGCNLMNVVLNWVFIFGHCGFEAMGATGAGVATLISRIAMPLVAIWYFYRRKRLREYAALLPEVRYSRRSVRQLVRMGVPISGQMFLEASAFVLTSIMMGWFDAVAISANQIALTMGNFAFMIVTAVGAATTIRISHCYGARRSTNWAWRPGRRCISSSRGTSSPPWCSSLYGRRFPIFSPPTPRWCRLPRRCSS